MTYSIISFTFRRLNEKAEVEAEKVCYSHVNHFKSSTRIDQMADLTDCCMFALNSCV